MAHGDEPARRLVIAQFIFGPDRLPQPSDAFLGLALADEDFAVDHGRYNCQHSLAGVVARRQLIDGNSFGFVHIGGLFLARSSRIALGGKGDGSGGEAEGMAEMVSAGYSWLGENLVPSAEPHLDLQRHHEPGLPNEAELAQEFLRQADY